ncbi:hypothetical protein Tco_0982227 [Tanacetum coccineum]
MFLENLKQLHINLPFIEALAQIPKYAKFLKGLLTNKARLEEACTITINERCSAVLLNKLLSKEKDPWSFTIPYNIGQLHINNALADLGASISLMPYMMYKKLGLGEPKATRMSLELANRKTFLATARAMIDLFNKKITLRVGDDEVIFDVDQSIKRPPAKDDECYGVDDSDDTINAEAQELLASDKYDTFLLKGLEKSIDQSDLESCESFKCKAVDNSDSGEPIRRINSVNTLYPVVRDTTEPNKVESENLYSASANENDEKKPELKILPHHLEYAYLHGDKSFPIIISSAFPSFCTHKILMEDDYKPVIQPQRRLNPKVQDVVKNEIVKLLDSGMIYPISDSSPGHDAWTIAKAADRAEDVDYVRALQASEHRMITSIEELHDARTNRRDIRLEIDVVRGQRTTYETELHEVRQAYLSSEARNRALLARLETLETHMSRMKWQRQRAEDDVVR